MKKSIIICFALAMIAVGCNRVTVDFNFSPAEPKAGQSVKFNNTSSAGESWAWTFGDNTTSRLKHPSKVFSRPGEYVVTLMVDSAKYKTMSKSITVYDTIPTFVASEDSILLYHDVELKANVYNPFGHTLTFEWTLPANAVLHSGELTDESIVVYFTKKGSEKVMLKLQQKDQKFDIEKTVNIFDVQAPSILMQIADGSVVRQRIINDRLEDISAATSLDVLAVAAASDTAVIFNGVTFYANELGTTIPALADLQVAHLQIDAMAQKWYLSTNQGLVVTNFDGSDKVVIDEKASGALCVDATRNRLYWASEDGVYALPLIKSKNNQFTTDPVKYNNLNNVDLIIVNNTPQ